MTGDGILGHDILRNNPHFNLVIDANSTKINEKTDCLHAHTFPFEINVDPNYKNCIAKILGEFSELST